MLGRAAYEKQVEAYKRLVRSVNRRQWWHCVPSDPMAYSKTGKFYASSCQEAQFYGVPGPPERVTVRRPLVVDNAGLETFLFGERIPSELWEMLETFRFFYEFKNSVDRRLRDLAAERGFDSIALLSDGGFRRWLQTGKAPRSIELNVLHPAGLAALAEHPSIDTSFVFVPRNKYTVPEGYYRAAQFAELSARFGCHPEVVQFLCDMFGN